MASNTCTCIVSELKFVKYDYCTIRTTALCNETINIASNEGSKITLFTIEIEMERGQSGERLYLFIPEGLPILPFLEKLEPSILL